MQSKQIAFNYKRKFGLEIELNTFDNRDFNVRPLERLEYPDGAFYIANLFKEKLGADVRVSHWTPVHNNQHWIIKPDRSCGMELCTPVLSGWNGLRTVLVAIDLLSKNHNIKADKRCSLHMHVSIDDLTIEQIKSIFAYWIKFEHLFLLSVPDDRKNNKFCQSIGTSPVFEHNEFDLNSTIITKLSTHKYWTLNSWRYMKGDRNTIEFRIIENEGCTNAFLVKNWARLIIHFIESVKNMPFPVQYQKDNRWSSLLWLDIIDLMNVLGFLYEDISVGMIQTRNWFLARIHTNLNSKLSGVWKTDMIKKNKAELDDIIKLLKIKDIEQYLEPDNRLSLFNNGF